LRQDSGGATHIARYSFGYDITDLRIFTFDDHFSPASQTLAETKK
jgi:hypothetical protein